MLEIWFVFVCFKAIPSEVIEGLGKFLSVNNVLRKWTDLVAVYLSKLQFRPPSVKQEVDELRKLVDEMRKRDGWKKI